MPRRPTREIVEELLDRYEPRIRDAFLSAIDDIRSAVVLRALVERLERGDIAGAIEVLQIDADAFGNLELAIAEAYNGSGQATVENLPRVTDPSGARVLFRWGVRNPEAEAWLREHSSTLVTRIVQDQREGIRQALSEGLAQGQNPRSTALDIVGRVNRATGKREGGVIGLTSAQERYVARARQELLSSEPDQLRNYLTRERRDKRFDRIVVASIRTGKPIPAETVNRVVGRYSDKLLQLRGETLGRAETFFALSRSRDDAFRQQIAAGKIDRNFVTKGWRHTAREHPRVQHIAMNGQTVAFDEPFIAPDGTRLQYPHDPNAPASHTLGCLCQAVYKIDYIGQLARRRAA